MTAALEKSPALVHERTRSDRLTLAPVHLLTRKASSLYATKLRPGGAIAFNVSSRYFELAPVVAAAAGDLGLGAARRDDLALTRGEQRVGKEMSGLARPRAAGVRPPGAAAEPAVGTSCTPATVGPGRTISPTRCER